MKKNIISMVRDPERDRGSQNSRPPQFICKVLEFALAACYLEGKLEENAPNGPNVI